MIEFSLGWIALSFIPVYILNAWLLRKYVRVLTEDDESHALLEIYMGITYLFGTAAIMIGITGFIAHKHRNSKLNPIYWLSRLHKL